MHNSEQLVEFSLLVSSMVAVMQNLDFYHDLSSCSNVRIVMNKLPPNLKERWCSNISRMEANSVTLLEFDRWLQDIAATHELLMETSEKPSKGNVKHEKTKTFATDQLPPNDKKLSKCPCCDEGHPLWKCSTFKEKPIFDRIKFVKEKKICFSCLDGQHYAKSCSKKLTCKEKGCKSSHNTLLHKTEKPKTALPAIAECGEEANVNSSKESFQSKLPRGILQVIKVKIAAHGKEVETLALCDTGSTLSWISPALKEKLNLIGEKRTISLQGFTGHQNIESTLHKIGVKSMCQQVEDLIEVLVKPNFKIGSDKLDVKTLKREYPHLEPIEGGIIDLSKIDVLLGQSAFKLIRPLEYKYVDENKPWAVKLPLGWALSGPLPPSFRETATLTGVFVEETYGSTLFSSLRNSRDGFYEGPVKAESQRELCENHFCQGVTNACNCQNNDQLSNQLKEWWDIESYGSRINVTPRSKEDKKSLQILEKTTLHNGERYVVGMLWKEGKPDLPNNFIVAKSQLLALEKRLDKDEALRQRYSDTIKVDLEKKYIRKVEAEELDETKENVQWYLPHHPVINPNKPGKVRRVCNAASKFKGTSLNDALMTGPDLLNNLVGILLRFRSNPIVLMADVEAMFLQIATPEEDQRTTRFLWREGPTEEIEVYQYLVRIFGGKDSPTCANYALQRTGSDNQGAYPEASKVIKKDFYMDDLVKAVEHPETGVKLYHDLKELMKLGGFKLTKWFSNNERVMESFKKDGEVLGVKEGEPPILTVLGMLWDAEEDLISVARGLDAKSVKVTQRAILSAVSSVFDPLGLLAPFMIKARLLLKSVWQSMGQLWDENVSPEHAMQFERWLADLQEAKEMKLKRKYFETKPTSIELHAFADASETAMCAVIYFRGVYDDGTFKVAFAIGKSRVSPMRHMTIPKMELQAALIATRIVDQITKEFELPIIRRVFWSDSSTVLQWLKNSEKKQPVFVCNRVQEILESTTVDQWRYVPTADNPADHGTRGMSPQEMAACNWFNGPDFLHESEEFWPISPFQPSCNLEENIATVACIDEGPVIDWEKHSKFSKLRNVVAYCMKVKPSKGSLLKDRNLQAQELRDAEIVIWRICQGESFPKEIEALKRKEEILSKSPIKNLQPFLDDQGLLRAGGRLKNCIKLPNSSKFPIILDANHRAVKLYLQLEHVTYFHQGVEYLRARIQENFWILKLRSALRTIKQNCLPCKKNKASTFKPLMADLPKERLNPIHPFAEIGVDYFGPFFVTFARKTLKRYGFLFTCLTTRAVHLEVCHSLDTDSCMMAVQRFIARRGKPITVISDNGSNFVGAVKELKECWRSWDRQDLVEKMAHIKVNWKFIPPGSPHFGGVWERMVQSCKKAIYSILQTRRVSDEVLSTVMCLAEQTLNARPITPVSSDIEDLDALTPNHFLLGRPSYNLPLCWTPPSNINFKKAYKQAELYSQQIWQRWYKEFLPQLNPRSRWSNEEKRPIDEGDLVWLIEEGSPRSVYPLARVLELHPGADGRIRSAKIKTKTGVYVRPVVKLVPLEVKSIGVPKTGNRAGDV